MKEVGSSLMEVLLSLYAAVNWENSYEHCNFFLVCCWKLGIALYCMQRCHVSLLDPPQSPRRSRCSYYMYSLPFIFTSLPLYGEKAEYVRCLADLHRRENWRPDVTTTTTTKWVLIWRLLDRCWMRFGTLNSVDSLSSVILSSIVSLKLSSNLLGYYAV